MIGICRSWIARGGVVLLVLILGSQIGGAQIVELVIDPGHGGTDSGTQSPDGSCLEKDVNLWTAFALRDTLNSQQCVEGSDYLLTRTSDVFMTPEQKAEFANLHGATEFISIHHNGNVDTSINKTMTVYDVRETTATDEYRDTSGVLATKVGLRISQEFKIKRPTCFDNWACTGRYRVLRPLESMASTLTEASHLTNPGESALLCTDLRTLQEAGAIYHGWESYLAGSGFGIVRNACATGGGGSVTIDGAVWESPFAGTWRVGEVYEIRAGPTISFPDGNARSFSKWVHIPYGQSPRDTLQHEVFSVNPVTILIDAEPQIHEYVALYPGGPYNASITVLADTVYVADSSYMQLVVPPGADSTTVFNVTMDRNGGSGGYPESIGSPEFYSGDTTSWLWYTGPPATSSARLKIEAHDYAGNTVTATSNSFVIYDCGQLDVSNEGMNAVKPQIDSLFLDYDCNMDHNLALAVYRWDAGAWTLVDSAHTGTSFLSGHTRIAWPIDPAHQGVSHVLDARRVHTTVRFDRTTPIRLGLSCVGHN